VTQVQETYKELGLPDAKKVTMGNVLDQCPVFAHKILMQLLDCEIEGFIHTPLFMSDHDHNARLCLRVLETIIPGISLDHIDPRKVGSGDRESCLNLLEIVCETYRAVVKHQEEMDDSDLDETLGEEEDMKKLLAEEDGESEQPDPEDARALSEIEDLEELHQKLYNTADKPRKGGGRGRRRKRKTGRQKGSKLISRRPRRTIRKPVKGRKGTGGGAKKSRNYASTFHLCHDQVGTRADELIQHLRNIRSRTTVDAKAVSKKLASARKRLQKNSEQEVIAMRNAVNDLRATFRRKDSKLYRKIMEKMESVLNSNGYFSHLFQNRIKEMVKEMEVKELVRGQWEGQAIGHLFKSAIQGQKLARRDYTRMFKEEVTRLMNRELVMKRAMIKYLEDQQDILQESLNERARVARLNARAAAKQKRQRYREMRRKGERDIQKLLNDIRQNEQEYKFAVSNLTPENVLPRWFQRRGNSQPELRALS